MQENIAISTPSSNSEGVLNTDNVSLKVRDIIADGRTPKNFNMVIYKGIYIISENKSIPISFNDLKYKKLKNTGGIRFLILGDGEEQESELSVPEYIRERFAKYLREQDKIIEANKNSNGKFHCREFVEYMREFETSESNLEVINSENELLSGDVIYFEGDNGYFHYMIYLGEGFCLSKNGELNPVITRHNFEGMYKVVIN